jgi:thioredoxin 1
MRTMLVLFGITLLIVLLGIWHTQPPATHRSGGGNIAEATDADFDEVVLHNKQLVLVDFWAPWCGPCRMVAPAVEDMADEFTGKLKVVRVNVDDARETAKRYQVSSIPAMVVFRNGKVLNRRVGVPPGDVSAAMSEWLKQILE